MSIERETLVEFMEVDMGLDMSDIDDDTKLFSSGIVDSFSLVTLMTFIEGEAGFRLISSDMILDNFDSINNIIAFAEQGAARAAE
ncbi:MAG: hypothetical protein KDK10_12205 [Maritimibacter sp.]|nr:hypothetical protein [Maritimibacter sp.]